ncbi:cation diffusion facilitator family transporter [Pontibacter sp. G13]|uniref:cation diffusion facilitator family transporter n=1 Tax=Pontibacter sp. G13 TaxID=3074898 RepID=UPI002888FB76|nr:cation diffusion facilitator family transporter [Pontibacter sp. G13]WNJ21597.1 cation diffusion facilitator family transporter [Pontibacter sp. G13]
MVQQQNIRYQAWILVAGTLLLAGKFAAYFLTQSNAILSDALESIVNVSAGAFALFSLVYAARPEDENHPYGHGKIEFISASIEGALIVLAGMGIVVKAGYNLIHPQELQRLDLGIWITAGAGAVNYLLGYLAEQRGNRVDSMALRASGKHLKSDAWTSLGLLGGIALVYLTGVVWLDNVLALGFGGYILWIGVGILRQSLAGIMDEADYQLIKRIVKILNQHRHENWVDIHKLRTIKFGSRLHIDSHLTLPWYLSVQEAHDEVDAIQEVINEAFGKQVEMFVHVDPCLPSSCPICTKADCPQRKAEFQKRIEWRMRNLMADARHGLDPETPISSTYS